MVALGYEPDKVEEAEYAVLVRASVWGLARYGERLVVVAEVPDDRVFPADDDDVELDNGAVRLGALPAGRSSSWFGDEARRRATSSAAARAASGSGIDEAWDKPEVQALITGHEHAVARGRGIASGAATAADAWTCCPDA